jgi:hypothetical protein
MIRDAILKAAAHIEANPGKLNFSRGHIPKRSGGFCGGTCPLAWIGEFMEGDYIHSHGDVARELGCHPSQFYNEMDELSNYPVRGWYFGFAGSFAPWATDAKVCAETLRKYADKHYPVGIPDSIRRIFDRPFVHSFFAATGA